ncbi:MAG TPA: AAA family ATPase [Chlamydiales bacterium]|nr:ATP-binding protein [Chlamydiales bacterium]HPE84663.1 AAA family ATPase [Chlamydiales bacterium]
MKRDIYKALEDWKKSSRRKPLIINGARQVGKTYALKHFGQTAYKETVYLNFEKEKKLSQYFEGTLDPQQIVKILSIHAQKEIRPVETLIVFDEIQECPKALNSLKYFCEEANAYHVVAAGSLLGVKTANAQGFPVGKVNFLSLYPLNFFEFLSALGQEELRQFLMENRNFDPIPIPLHEKLIHLLKLYFFIGGMPEAVAEYVKNENLTVVREIQLEILDAYEKDFAKHAPPNEIMNITTVWKQIHRQLAKENKKFIFAAIRKSARGRDYENAMQWLQDAGLIHKSYLVESPKFPLSAYAHNSIFKIFLVDVGLLGAQSNLSPQVLIDGDLLFTEFKGALTENFVAQELIATKNIIPYYWTSSGQAEIDFLIEEQHEIYPLEVKAGASQKKKSLLVYKDKYHPSKLLRLSTMNLKHDDSMYNYPLYYISLLNNLDPGKIRTGKDILS